MDSLNKIKKFLCSNKDKLTSFSFVFIIFFITRFLTSPLHAHSEDFMWEGIMETCVKPWQLATGQAIENGDTCYLATSIHYLVSYWFGYSVPHLQFVTIVLTSLSMSLIFITFKKILGIPSSLIYLGFVLTSIPFTAHGMLTTNMATALHGLSIIMYALTTIPSLYRDITIAISILVALLGYAAGVVTVVPLLFFHILLFQSKWPFINLLRTGLLSSFAVGTVWYLRKIVTGHGSLKRWAVSDIGIPDIDSYMGVLKVILRDLFINADTWYALALDTPYLTLFTSLALGLTLVALLFSILNKKSSEIQDRNREIEKWCTLFLFTFIAAILIVSINPDMPGIRRIYPTILLLFGMISCIPQLIKTPLIGNRILYILFSIYISHEGWSNYRTLLAIEPPSPRDWIIAADKAKVAIRETEEPKVLFVDKEWNESLDRIFCGIYLTKELREKVIKYYGIETDQEGGIFISENGINPMPLSLPFKFKEDFLLLAKTGERYNMLHKALKSKSME